VALKNVIGIDHAVIIVKDLDSAADNWKRMGFTVSPRGTHSTHMGSGNYTIMLDPDYIELLGVLAETEHNAPARAFLANRGEGIERIAFTAVDSAAGADEIRSHGYPPIGPIDFERPVRIPDGTLSAAKFRIFQWPTAEAPGGVRIFACEHKTRETVWIPELMKHPNGAKRLRQVLIATPEPAKEAAHLSRLIDRDARKESDGAVVVPSGSDRADFAFLTPEQLGSRYAGIPLAGMPERGGAGLVIASTDLPTTERVLGSAGVRGDGVICVPPSASNGTLLVFAQS
jgi:glyoxalase-like protein